MAKLDLQPVQETKLDLQPELDLQPDKLDLQPEGGPTTEGMAKQFFIGVGNSASFSALEFLNKKKFDKLESPHQEERIARGVGTAVGTVVGVPGLVFKIGEKLAMKGMAKLAPEMIKASTKGSAMAKAIVEGAGGGAAYNLLDPTTPLEDKPLNVLGGTIAGGVIGASGKVAVEAAKKVPGVIQKMMKSHVPTQGEMMMKSHVPTQGVAPKAGVSPSSVVASPSSVGKPWDMSSEELGITINNEKISYGNELVTLFGEEGSKKYRSLERKANSLSATFKETNQASDELQKMQDSLTKAQQNRLFGIDEDIPDVELLKNLKRVIDSLDDRSPESLGQSLKHAITKVGKKTNPAEMDSTELEGYVALKNGVRLAKEKGFSLDSVLENALTAAGKRFANREDAMFMLKPILDNLNKAKASTPIPGVAMGVTVPDKFKNTNEALAYGWENRNDPQILKMLKAKQDEASAMGEKIRSLADPTDAQMQEGMNIAVKGQLYREALEAATGKITQADFDRIQAKLGQKAADQAKKTAPLNAAVSPPTTFLPTGQAATPNPRADLVPSFKRLVPQDAKNLIADLDKRQTEILAADRGIIPAKVQNDLSKNIDAKKILDDWQPGQTVNAETMFAMRNHLVDQVLKLSKTATADEVEALSHQFIKADAMASETGRTLGSLNKIQSMASDQIRFLTEHFKVLSPDAQAAAAKVFKQFQAPTFWDKFMEFRVAALLTSPFTHVRNALGNSVVRFYNPVQKTVAGGFDAISSAISRAPRSTFAAEGLADAIGAVHGIKPALGNALKKLMDENFISESRMMEALKHNQAIGGLAGKVVRSPFRALDAMDEFFSTLAHSSSLYSQATRQALKEGGKDWVDRAAQLVKQPSLEMIAKAREAALYDTYRQPLGASMGHLQAFFNGRGVVSKTAKFIVPFFKTPVNLFKWSYQRGPVTSMMPGAGNWKAIMKGSPEQKAEAWAKIAIGQMVGAGIGLQVMDGTITGRISSNKDVIASKARLGIQPYSVKIGDKYISYRSYEPITSWLALTANAIETAKEEGNMNPSTAIKVTAETVKMMKDQSFLQGISDLTNALDDPERYGQKFIQNAATSLIPSGVGYLARLYDPVVREPESIPDAIRAKLPGFSKGLPPKLDVWGRPITREGTLSQRAILPSGAMTSKPDMAENELLSLEKFPQKINRVYKGLNLTVSERNEITKTEGGLEKNYLDQMVNMPYYQTLTPEEQSQAIEKMFTEVRKAVRTPFFQQKFVGEYRKLKTNEERAALLEKYTNKKLIKK